MKIYSISKIFDIGYDISITKSSMSTQTLISESTFRRYRRFFCNHDIEYGYVDIEVTVFDIEKNVEIVIFDIDVNVDIGGGKVPDVPGLPVAAGAPHVIFPIPQRIR